MNELPPDFRPDVWQQRPRRGVPWTEDELRLVRRLSRLGLSQKAIGSVFGVGQTAISGALASDIRRRRGQAPR